MNFRLRFAIGLFLALSVADFMLTWLLLNRSSGIAYESNPIAAWFLDNSGWIGLAMFKALIVLFVIVAAIRLEQRRPRSAGSVLAFGCASLVAVVGYSAVLLQEVHSPETIASLEILERSEATSRELDSHHQRNKRYQEFVYNLYQAVADGSMTLPIAARNWLNHDIDLEPRWLTGLKIQFDTNEVEMRLAIKLAQEINDYWRWNPDREKMLENQFKEHYGIELATMRKRNDVMNTSITASDLTGKTRNLTAARESPGDGLNAWRAISIHNPTDGKSDNRKTQQKPRTVRITRKVLSSYGGYRFSLRI